MIQVFPVFLLFILPFIVNPFGGAFFEAPKVILAEVVIEMLTVYFLLRHKLRLEQILLYPVGLLFVISILDLILFPSPTVFLGNQFRLQGTFLLWHLLILSLIASQIELKIPKLFPYLSPLQNKGRFYLLPALLLVTFLMGSQSNGRAIGTLGEPNALAAVAIFFWPFVWFYDFPVNHSGKVKWLIKSLSLILVLVVIFLSGSRSGFVALIIQSIFLISLYFLKDWKKAVMIAIVLFLSSLVLPLLNPIGGYKFEDRLEVWRISIAAGLKSPIIGQGFGNVEKALKSSAQSLNSDLQYQYVDSAHNIFLDFWIEGGLIGLSLLLALVIISFKNFIRLKKILEIVLLLGLITVLSFNPASIVTLIVFWWILGQGYRSSNLD